MEFIKKMKTREKTPLKSDLYTSMLGFIGGFCVISLLLLLTNFTQESWIMAPFGASCVLAFGVWDSPLSQPRNIVGGHLIATSVGLLFRSFFAQSIVVIAVAVGLAIALMILTKTTHPPAGADPLVVLLSTSDIGWSYLLTPVLLGSVVIVLVALIINNLSKKRKYPKFWV